jgi:uncharacterized protein (DUF2252 family)
MTDTTDIERARVELAPMVPHFTAAERAARGRAARAECPRAGHTALDPPDRDPVAILEEQAASRVPELVPIRYGRMLVSPFTFYRGAAAIMAHDLAPTPRAGLQVQLCGDAHLANFGGYASPERTLVFDLNDFDETLPGPFEWDVKRLATSFEIAGRDRGFTQAQRDRSVLRVVRAYREAMRQFAEMTDLDVWYARLDVSQLESDLRAGRQTKATQTIVDRLEKASAKARTKDSMKAFSKLTEEVDGEPRIAADPPLIVPARDLVTQSEIPIEEIIQELHATFRNYRRTLQRDRRHLLEQYRWIDLAHKVVGVGSVGTRCFIVLLMGRDNADPLFLQIKEAQRSVLEPMLGRSEFANSGQRVVEGQRLMQAASDIFLGWIHLKRTLDGPERDFYVRQLWDWKVSVDLDLILPEGLDAYARVCGWTLARAHARSGDRIAIASYLGKADTFDRAVHKFARAYADLNERDHATVRKAAQDRRITAVDGV